MNRNYLASSRRNSWALLPAGSLNLKTGKSTHFDVVENNSGEVGTLILVKIDFAGYKVLSSAGGNGKPWNNYAIGARPMSHHDQTLRFNMPYTIVGYYPATKAGMKLIYDVVDKTSVSFSVFK